MQEVHRQLYSSLTDRQMSHLLRACMQAGLVDALPDPPTIDPLEEFSHAEIVLTLSRDTSLEGMEIVETLIERPIYMCARGETGAELTDIHGRPLPFPLGHRRGEPPNLGERAAGLARRRRHKSVKRDNRIITNIAPNPKRIGSAVYERYELYTEGLSVEHHIQLGLRRADIRWDASRGHIRLDPSPRG